MTKKTQEERRSEAESKLIEAAREIVARKGWVGMTLGDVGIAAGYSRGIAGHYFGSKTELLRALAVNIGNTFLGGFKAQERTPGLCTLLDFVAYYLGRDDTGWTNTRALLILMAEGTTDNSEVGENLALYNRSIVDFLALHFRGAIDADEAFDHIAPEISAITLLGTVRGILLQRLLKNSSIDLRAVSRAVLLQTIRSHAKNPQGWMDRYGLLPKNQPQRAVDA